MGNAVGNHMNGMGRWRRRPALPDPGQHLSVFRHSVMAETFGHLLPAIRLGLSLQFVEWLQTRRPENTVP